MKHLSSSKNNEKAKINQNQIMHSTIYQTPPNGFLIDQQKQRQKCTSF